MALSSVAYHWRSSRWLCHAPFAASLPPLASPSRGLSFLLPSPHRSPSVSLSPSALFSSSPQGSGFTELRDKEVQACLAFLDPPCGNIVGSFSSKCRRAPLALTSSVSLPFGGAAGVIIAAFLLESPDGRDSVPEKWKDEERQSQPRRSCEMFSAELCGQRAWVLLCASGR